VPVRAGNRRVVLSRGELRNWELTVSLKILAKGTLVLVSEQITKKAQIPVSGLRLRIASSAAAVVDVSRPAFAGSP
jgi:hypothetical protein